MKRIINFSFFTCLIVLIFITNQSMATTFCVSDEANLIAALNEAKANGSDDIIKIQQGTYNGNFVYASTESFGVTVEGGYTALCASRVVDPTNTILDGGKAGIVLVLSAPGVAANFIVEGITFQNGDYTNSGGLHIIGPNGTTSVITLNNNIIGNNFDRGLYVKTYRGEVTLNNNTISNNFGTGLYIDDKPGKVTLNDNTIINNSGSGLFTNTGPVDEITLNTNTIKNNSGHGVQLETVLTLNLTNNTISDNSQLGIYFYRGVSTTLSKNVINNNQGGIAGGGGVVSIINNTITDNDGRGGVVFRPASPITFTNNIIINNSSNSKAGGVTVDNAGTVTFINNIINDNISNQYGGGLALTKNHTTTLMNNIICNNGANFEGGGIYFYGGTIGFINNTICNNSTSESGGGMKLRLEQNSDIANIYNNIIWNNNAADDGADIYLNNDGNNDFLPSPVNLYNNDFDQSAKGTYIQIPFPIDPSNLNNEDPLFINPVNDDFHLQPTSPCKDAGKDAGVYVDMDGDHRPLFSGFDIGADELQIDDLVIENQTLSTTQGFGACETITAGPAVNVTPTGDVNFQAGTKVMLKSGFSVEDGGRLSVVVDPSTCP